MRAMRRFALPVLVLAWLAFLVGPIAYLFAPQGAVDREWLTGLPTAFEELLGARWGRWMFAGLWIAMNAAVAWWLAISKKPYDIGPSLDLDD